MHAFEEQPLSNQKHELSKPKHEKENGLPEVYSTQMHTLATRLLDSFRDEIGAIFSERSRKAEETLKAGRMK